MQFNKSFVFFDHDDDDLADDDGDYGARVAEIIGGIESFLHDDN